MKTYDDMSFHPVSEQLVEILCAKTQNTNPQFFRVMTAYYFSLVASMMRCKIIQPGGEEIPINMYAINLATSGAGKGKATNVLEDTVLNQFKYEFTQNTFLALAEQNLPLIALDRSISKSTAVDTEVLRVEKEFNAIGPMPFAFDSATTPAIKEVRHKLLLANAGALNLQIDEIGNNLSASLEPLAAYLELYDMGKIKPKLIKNTADNVRREEIVGSTPANLMMFGTPPRLLNGGKTEEEFTTLLETGYARRCFFGYALGHARRDDLTPQEILAMRKSTTTDSFLSTLSDTLGKLADIIYANKRLQVNDDVALIFIEYQLQCERAAAKLGEHEEMKKAEWSHRYFKTLKLAGTYAFIDGSPEITEDHAYHAIKLAEASGKAFEQLLARDRAHVKLAKYIASVGHDITQADLVEDLPFYRGTVGYKSEMLQLAIAYGYQNNIIIKKHFTDGIEFFSGETLKTNDLTEIRVSYGRDLAVGYKNDTASFDQLHKMTQAHGIHWVNHHLREGMRREENAIPGFNIVVLDVDHGINVSTAQMLLKDYKALFYTTKSHTDIDHSFRIILPMNFELKLDAPDFKAFMAAIYQWLPFEVDTATGQRARKWLSHSDQHGYQDGKLLDVLPFIPKTTKNDTFNRSMQDQKSLNNMERWVLNSSGDGNRNNMLLRYALVLVDANFDFEGVRNKVTALNEKMPDQLTEAEIVSTIMVTAGKAISKR